MLTLIVIAVIAAVTWLLAGIGKAAGKPYPKPDDVDAEIGAAFGPRVMYGPLDVANEFTAETDDFAAWTKEMHR